MREITVLIIDENPDVRRLLVRGLRGTPGFRVLAEAGNPMMGAELAREMQPDVIVADFRQTGPLRVQAFRWISRLSPRSRLVALTSYFSAGEEQACGKAGVSKCLLKGLSVKELGKELQSLMETGELARSGA